MLPFLVARYPQLTDYPSHLARYHVMLDGGRSPILAGYYGFEWHLAGNLGADLLMVPLGRPIGAGSLLAFALIWSPAIGMGFYNFCLSLALALFAFAAWGAGAHRLAALAAVRPDRLGRLAVPCLGLGGAHGPGEPVHLADFAPARHVDYLWYLCGIWAKRPSPACRPARRPSTALTGHSSSRSISPAPDPAKLNRLRSIVRLSGIGTTPLIPKSIAS